MAAVPSISPLIKGALMGLQLQSAEFLHDDGITYCIRRETLEQDFTSTKNAVRNGLIAASIRP